MPMFRSVSRIRELRSREECRKPLTRCVIESRPLTRSIRFQDDNCNLHEFRSANKSCNRSKCRSQCRCDAIATVHRPTRSPIHRNGYCVKPEFCNKCNRRVPTSTLSRDDDCNFKVERCKTKKVSKKCRECECDMKKCSCNARYQSASTSRKIQLRSNCQTCDSIEKFDKRQKKSSKVLGDPFPRQIKYKAVLVATRSD